MVLGSENMRRLRSDHSSRRQVMPATWRREAGVFNPQKREVREMRNAETVLGIIHERGNRREGKTLESWMS